MSIMGGTYDAYIAIQEAERQRLEAIQQVQSPAIRASAAHERSGNVLRPEGLDDVIGQDQAKSLLAAAVRSSKARNEPLDHMLMVGPSGTGKTTLAHVIASEVGADVYELEAPVSMDTLLELRTTMKDGDILKIEEIHQQAVMERRGRSSATQPEVLYAVMEDRVIPTSEGILPFPKITLIGTTTDEGMLPDAFVNRFPLKPRLRPYTVQQLDAIAIANSRDLNLRITYKAARIFASASRGVPREVNNLVRNALVLTEPGELCDAAQAMAVLESNEIESDGITADMRSMLVFLLTRARQVTADGEVKHQASVSTIATAIGKSRDSKAISLRVEPFLIGKGYVQVTHGGRRLTDAGIKRAAELARKGAT